MDTYILTYIYTTYMPVPCGYRVSRLRVLRTYTFDDNVNTYICYSNYTYSLYVIYIFMSALSTLQRCAPHVDMIYL